MTQGDLRAALEYASQNPKSDFATQLNQRVISGQADAEAQKLGLDLTPIKNYVNSQNQQNTPDSTTTSDTTSTQPSENLGQKVADNIQQHGEEANRIINDPTEGNPLTRGVKAAGQAAEAVAAPITETAKDVWGMLPDAFTKNFDNFNGPTKIGVPKPETDQTNAPANPVEKAIFQWSQQHPDAYNGLKNTLQALTAGGEIAGTISGAGEAATAAGEVPSLSTTASDAKDAVIKTVTSNPIKTAAKQLNQSIQDTMPITDKANTIESLRNTLPNDTSKGGVSANTNLKGATPEPSPHDIEVGQEAHPYISGVKNPIEKIANVNKAIIDKSTATNAFLDSHPTQVNMQDIEDYLDKNNTPEPTIKNDPNAYKAYQDATQNAKNVLYNTLKTSAKESGNFTGPLSGSDIRAARIAVDKQITQQLGEATFGTPQYTGIKAAEVSARNTINSLNEDLLRYPNQLEALNKYNEDIATFKDKGIQITPEAEQALKDRVGLKSTSESEANAQKLSDQHQSMSNLYDARDNMIDRTRAQVESNKGTVGQAKGIPYQIQAWAKANPIKAKALGYGAGAVGADVVYKHFF